MTFAYQQKTRDDYVSHNEKFMRLVSWRAKTDPSYEELLEDLLSLETQQKPPAHFPKRKR